MSLRAPAETRVEVTPSRTPPPATVAHPRASTAAARPATPAAPPSSAPRSPPAPRKRPIAQAATEAPRRYVTPAGVFAVLAAISLYVGWRFPTQLYITPERGIGYALGIIGGSC